MLKITKWPKVQGEGWTIQGSRRDLKDFRFKLNVELENLLPLPELCPNIVVRIEPTKVDKPDFVTITQEAQATIAQDLEAVLEEING